MKVIIFLSIFFITPLALGGDDVFSFKDDHLGMTLKSFKANHVTITRSTQNNNCTRTSSCSGKIDSQKNLMCTDHGDGYISCYTPVTIVGAQAGETAFFLHEHLFAMGITLPAAPRALTDIDNGLVEKFGSRVTIEGSNTSNPALLWESTSSIAMLEPQYCSVFFQKPDSLPAIADRLRTLLNHRYCDPQASISGMIAYLLIADKALSSIAISQANEQKEKERSTIKSDL